ncbi:MAG: hypothetical protein R2932_08775 [Caldilineaceae bacterium]
MITNRQLEHSQSQLQYARDNWNYRLLSAPEHYSSNQMLHGEIVERQQLMEALQLSEANWRSLVENAPERSTAVSIDGTIVFINRAFRN